ncbi:MAG: DUF222 domain-containing protein [Acidimicrobiales bacterium]
MCERLAELEAGMRRFAASFDAAVLSADQAGSVVAGAAALERMAATVKALAAARMADTGAWKASGERSAAHALARSTGTSVGQASESLATAKRLRTLPLLGAAARAGELSFQQAAAVADAASADPAAEHRLLAKAKRSSLAELREECARTKAAALPDAEARRRAIHAQRFLRSYLDGEGAWNLRMRDNPEVGAAVMAAIEPIRDRLFRAARAEGRKEPTEAYAADALAELATKGPSNARARAKTIVRVDLDALLRGRAIEGETCEIAGFGPVAVSAVRELLDSGDPFLAAVVTKGEQVVGVAHLGRRPTAAQQTALEWLYPTCAAEGCSAGTWLENDHRVDWATTHLTVLDLLDRLCSHHHDLKSLDGWALVEGQGKRPFVPPDDPRHPRSAHAPPVVAA